MDWFTIVSHGAVGTVGATFAIMVFEFIRRYG
jgi:hypothetical protein